MEITTILRIGFSAYCLLLFGFGLSGYLMKNKDGFLIKQQMEKSYGKLGTILHFCKVVVVPLILAVLVWADQIVKALGI